MIGIQTEVPDLVELIKEEERDILRLATFGTANRMKAVIAEPGTGKSYPRGNTVHIASSPGKPPTSDSGNLINTIMPNMEDFFGEIDLAFHGLVMEFGTEIAGRNRNVTIAPRPFIIPSLEEILQDL